MKERLAAQMYSVRSMAKTPEDIRTAFLKLRDIGYRAVQVSGIGPIEAERLREYSLESGLPIVCTHNSFQLLSEDLDKIIADHKIFDCRYIGLGGMPAEPRTDYEALKGFIRAYGDIAKRVEAAGCTLCYHNHAFEFAKLGGKRIIDMLIEELPTVSFILDTYWVQFGGGDVPLYMRKLKGRLQNLHLKDMAVDPSEGPGKPYITEMLEGNINFDTIIKTAPEVGVEWYIVEQDTCPGNPFDSMRISYENLAKRYN